MLKTQDQVAADLAAAEEARRRPILDGDVYCSPRCGHRCKRAAYDRAVCEADALAELLGEGWEPIISENGGWHYKVAKANSMVAPMLERGGCISGDWKVIGYSAWIDGPVIGSFHNKFIANADHPDDALGFATQYARTAIARLEEELAALINDRPIVPVQE